MGWFKDLLGTSNWQTAAPTPTVASGPLGMAQGKAVRFDTTLALLLDGSTTVRVPFDQAIWSHGWVDLGQSNKLHRYYMNDEDFWLQIHVTGEDQIESVTLFNYLSYVTVNSDAELQRLLPPGRGWWPTEVDNRGHDAGRHPACLVRPGALVQAWHDEAVACGHLRTLWNTPATALQRKGDDWQVLGPELCWWRGGLTGWRRWLVNWATTHVLSRLIWRNLMQRRLCLIRQWRSWAQST